MVRDVARSRTHRFTFAWLQAAIILFSFLPACQTGPSARVAARLEPQSLARAFFVRNSANTQTLQRPANRPRYKYHVTVSWSRVTELPLLSRLSVAPPPPSVLLLDSVERDEVMSFHSIPGITHRIVGAYGFYIALM